MPGKFKETQGKYGFLEEIQGKIFLCGTFPLKLFEVSLLMFYIGNLGNF